MASADAEIEASFRMTKEERVESKRRDEALSWLSQSAIKRRASKRQYYLRHRAEISVKQHLYYEKNRDRIIQKSREYRKMMRE